MTSGCCRHFRIIKRLKNRIRKLLEEKHQLKQENKELKEMIFRNKKGETDQEEEIKSLGKKRGAPYGHTGTTRIKPRIIDKEIEVKLDRCRYCNSENIKECNNYSEHIQEDIIMPSVEVTRYKHYYYYCNNCKKTMKSAAGANEIQGSYIGPTAKSVANYMRYRMGLSYEKIRDIFKKLFNMEIDKTSIYGFDNQAREKSNNVYDEIGKDIKESTYFHADETGWHNDGSNFWLWCMANENSIFYRIDKRRSSIVVRETVGNDYDGIIISDFLSTYSKLDYKKQKCLVHLLRMTRSLKGKYPNSCRVRDFCNKLDKLIYQILEAHKKINKNKISKLNFIELKAYIRSKMKALMLVPLPYPKADKFRKKLKNIQKELTVCLDYTYVPPHNNFVERQIRPNVILRKITFGTRSSSGMKNHQTLMSVIQTAILNKYPLMELLRNIHSGLNVSLSQLQNPPPS